MGLTLDTTRHSPLATPRPSPELSDPPPPDAELRSSPKPPELLLERCRRRTCLVPSAALRPELRAERDPPSSALGAGAGAGQLGPPRSSGPLLAEAEQQGRVRVAAEDQPRAVGALRSSWTGPGARLHEREERLMGPREVGCGWPRNEAGGGERDKRRAEAAGGDAGPRFSSTRFG